MLTKIAPHSGFCLGVRATISAIEEVLKHAKEPVYSIGLPVHNPQLTERLKAAGLCVVQSLDEIKEGILIVRAHGFTPQVMRDAEKKGLKIIDTTCVFVRRAQQIAAELSGKGYTVVITGERNHPEMISLAGFAGDKVLIVSNHKEARALELDGKFVGILSQTTQSRAFFDEVVHILETKPLRELRVADTICAGLQKTQDAAKELAREVDVMLVLGGRMSSNTKRLYEACKTVNKRSYHIETEKDLLLSIVKGAKSVGITAGASTPDWIIESVKHAIEAM
ncbi:MAG: 4-hydroxy-3-methylbut-2-enyl diphosphate reductase [Candidatus Omnitrophica bacterium]|nr:4-hydroxy-3-methylbut-2-enyl diphosphate reductase [Candidatus Omnitrophota bacterium]